METYFFMYTYCLTNICFLANQSKYVNLAFTWLLFNNYNTLYKQEITYNTVKRNTYFLERVVKCVNYKIDNLLFLYELNIGAL